MYTHVNMKNGEYAVLVKAGEMTFNFEDYLEIASKYPQDSVLKMGGFNLDGLKVTVSGSMYDDR
jgi:hypothetical protein